MATAIAHTRANAKYSPFHQSLLHSNEDENYALRHLYSVENTKIILKNLGWTPEEITKGVQYLTIDVQRYSVRLHIPGWEAIPTNQQKKYSVMNGTAKIINGVLCRKIRGISRLISKEVYVWILVERCWQKADPYKLIPSEVLWDEFIALGVQENYSINLLPHSLTCTCHAHSGVSKAFLQDVIALRHLQDNPYCQGQLPDKHIFAIWKYFHCTNLEDYMTIYQQRFKRAELEKHSEYDEIWERY